MCWKFRDPNPSNEATPPCLALHPLLAVRHWELCNDRWYKTLLGCSRHLLAFNSTCVVHKCNLIKLKLRASNDFLIKQLIADIRIWNGFYSFCSLLYWRFIFKKSDIDIFSIPSLWECESMFFSAWGMLFSVWCLPAPTNNADINWDIILSFREL